MALVVNGQLHTGAHGAAGEIGFMPVPEPAASKPGSSGDGRRSTTLEARASAAGVVRLARQLGMRGALTARRVFEAAAKGDPRAVEVVAAEVEAIAGAIAATAAVADPELVVLGGGIGRADGFAAAVGVELARLIPVPPDIRVSALGDEAIVEGGLVAGLDLAWDKILDRT
jgi:predicted NBD/HSP70 family sugar kinase